MRSIARVGLLLGLTAIACADLRDIMSLQQGLSKEFPNNAIGVNVNNEAYLTVTFTNSPAAQLPDSEQALLARHVAEFVRDHYAEYARLQEINVGFSTVTGSGSFHFTRTNVPYHFTPKDLASPSPDAELATPKQA